MDVDPKKGTTTVGIKGKDFVVLAADKLACLGDLASDMRTKKIHPIADYMALTTAGVAGDAQVIARFLSARVKRMEISEGRKPSPKRIAVYLSTILNANRFFPYLVQLILGGYLERPYLFSMDAVGGMEEVEDFTATGSGSPVAYGVLEAEYKENVALKDALKLAVRAIEAARIRNIFTGGKEPGIDVVYIDKEGIHWLSEKEVAQLKKR